MLIFSINFTFFVKELLLIYYDENKITFYHDEFFRMNIVGIQFNNGNLKHILRTNALNNYGYSYFISINVFEDFLVFPKVIGKGAINIKFCYSF